MLEHDLNRACWTPDRRGHYEVWYLTLDDPDSGWAFWLRHTLHVPAAPDQPANAFLWAFSFGPEGEGLQLIDRHPIAAFAADPGGFPITLGPARLEAGRARGEVGRGARRIAWELELGPSRGAFRHMSPLLWRARVAGSCVSTPVLEAAGRGWIEAGGRRFELRRARVEQGHVWGRRHADRWAWFHCHAFEGRDDALVEGFSAQVQKLGRLLPPASALTVRWGGREFTWNRPSELWRATSAFDAGGLWLEARRPDELLRIQLEVPPGRSVHVEYADPDDRRLTCRHTEAGRLTVEVFGKRGAGWELTERLRSERAAFEFGDRSRQRWPGRRLDLVEARPAG